MNKQQTPKPNMKMNNDYFIPILTTSNILTRIIRPTSILYIIGLLPPPPLLKKYCFLAHPVYTCVFGCTLCFGSVDNYYELHVTKIRGFCSLQP